MKRALMQLKRKVTDTAAVVSLYATARQDLDEANERIGVLDTELIALRRIRDEQARDLAALRSTATASHAAAASMHAEVVSKSRFDELQWQLRAVQHELKVAKSAQDESSDLRLVDAQRRIAKQMRELADANRIIVDLRSRLDLGSAVATVVAPPIDVVKSVVDVVRKPVSGAAVPKRRRTQSTDALVKAEVPASKPIATTATMMLDELDTMVDGLDVKPESESVTVDDPSRTLLLQRLNALLEIEILPLRPQVDIGLPTPRQMSTVFDSLRRATTDEVDAQIVAWLRRGVGFDSLAALICSRVVDDGTDATYANWLMALVGRGHELFLIATMQHATLLLVDGSLTSASAARALLRFALTVLVRANKAPLARMMVLDVLSLRRFFEPQLVDEALSACPSLLACDDDSDARANLCMTCAVLLRAWRSRVPCTMPDGAAADVAACDAALDRLGRVPVESARTVALALVTRFFAALDASSVAQAATWFEAARICAPAMQPQRVESVSCLRGDETAQAVLRSLREWPAAALDAACCLLAVCAQGGWLWTWHRVVTDAIWPRLLTRGDDTGAARAATRHHALRLCSHLAAIAASGSKRDTAAPLLHLRTLCASVLMPSFQSPLNTPSPSPPLGASAHTILYVPHAGSAVASLERAIDISGVVGWLEQEAAAHALCTTSFGAAKDLLIVRTWFRALPASLQQLVPISLQHRIET
jgi:hypothetical protein